MYPPIPMQILSMGPTTCTHYSLMVYDKSSLKTSYYKCHSCNIGVRLYIKNNITKILTHVNFLYRQSLWPTIIGLLIVVGPIVDQMFGHVCNSYMNQGDLRCTCLIYLSQSNAYVEQNMTRCGFKNGCQKDKCLLEVGLHACSKHDNHSKLNNHHNRGYLYDHLMSMRIFHFDNEQHIQVYSQKIMWKVATTLIWICYSSHMNRVFRILGEDNTLAIVFSVKRYFMLLW